jgi:hypothetical protein
MRNTFSMKKEAIWNSGGICQGLYQTPARLLPFSRRTGQTTDTYPTANTTNSDTKDIITHIMTNDSCTVCVSDENSPLFRSASSIMLLPTILVVSAPHPPHVFTASVVSSTKVAHWYEPFRHTHVSRNTPLSSTKGNMHVWCVMIERYAYTWTYVLRCTYVP